MNFKSLYADRPFWRVCLRLSIPIALQNLLSASFSIVDTFMVARLGGNVLAAAGMAGQWSWLLNIFAFGIISATSLFIAQYWGIKDIRGIHRTSGIAIISILAVSLVFMLTAFFLPEQIIHVFSRTPEVVEYGKIYLKYACFSYPAATLNMVLYSVLRSTESVRLPVAVSFFSAGLNAVLNYGLIFGQFGLPAWGIRGAAVATCISSWSGTVLIVVISLLTKNILLSSPRDMLSFKLCHWAEYYHRAVPVIANEAIWGVGTVTINAIFSNMGDDYYTGVTILRTFENLIHILVVGLCSACSVMVGKSIGAGKIKRAKEDALRFTAIMPIVCIITGILLITFRHHLIGAFTSGGNYTDAALTAALGCLLIYGLDMPVRNIPFLMIVGIFRPGGNTKLGMICDVSSLWLLAIPVTAILAFAVHLPFFYVFLIMYLVEDIPKSTLCLVYFFTGKWVQPVTDEGKRALTELNKSE